ncbi:MAG: zinc metalloprotease [Flavobacterium sp.]
MKKLFLFKCTLLLLFSCTSDNTNVENKDEMSSFMSKKGDSLIINERDCASQDILEFEMKKNPELISKIEKIEEFTKGALVSDIFEIAQIQIEVPVVVNVLYRTSEENISLSQIQSQINVLNQDFNGGNAEFNQVPGIFAGVKANVGITFVLDRVIRKQTTRTSWAVLNEEMKKTAFGGIAPTSPTNKLNLWVCTLSGGILGYAKAPGTALELDGVVIDSRYLGTNGRATAPFHKGRTATHEIGHWLNVRHIWGDSTCGNDLVADTPSHNAANYGSPIFPHYSTCPGTPIEMTMNFMDYTNDVSMYMFTNGQKDRMRAQFLPGGYRYSFVQ